ncbi:MAG: ABC transporter ATP-binding protein [Tissierellia bacterium]|nr:ABC transporter ATP-binding protein [Tissierellia bacterium]
MKFLWSKHRRKGFLALIFITISSAVMMALEYLKSLLIDQAIVKNIRGFSMACFLLFALVCIKAFTHYLYSIEFNEFKLRSLGDLRELLFESMVKRPYPLYLKRPTGEYLSLYNERTTNIEISYFDSLYGLLQIITELLMSMIFLWIIAPKFVFASGFSLLPALFVPQLLKKILSRAQKEKMMAINEHLSAVKEWLQGFETILSYHRIPVFSRLFDQSNDQLFRKSLPNDFWGAIATGISSLLVRFSSIFVLIFAAFSVARGEITIGKFVAAVGIMDQLTTQVVYISTYVKELLVVKVPMENIKDFLGDKPKISRPKFIIPQVETIDFQNLSFRHGDSDRFLFEDFQWHIHHPGIYEIRGPSGSGKSTLMSLLFGYHPPSKGEVNINNISVSEIGNLTDLITIMRQEAIFFDDSLRNNLTMYQEISDETIIQYMKALGLNQYAKPEYLQEQIINGDTRFSGGEARRFMVLRCLLRDSPILIFDEPFANVDKASVEKIEKLIQSRKNRYVFVISHKSLSEKDESICLS